MQASIKNVYLLNHYSREYTSKKDGQVHTFNVAEVFCPGESSMQLRYNDDVDFSSCPMMSQVDLELLIRYYGNNPSLTVISCTPAKGGVK